ncbi:MAG: DUF4198 domain-containing protein [Proteobacteria bacterium]|nr:DUF4198 domain-containing protein [Pseudomonadota bacterium]MBU1741773.1 DUF4198 domain-containing protein [Pseudomonadota bacterium]
MKRWPTIMRGGILVAALTFGLPVGSAQAHFQMVIPSQNVVQGKAKTITVKFVFTHPFEGKAMKMVKPAACGVMVGKKKVNLLGKLKPFSYRGQSAWRLSYKIKKPAVYMFFVAPAPYWEPAENKYIVHFTKSIVLGLGGEDDWDALVGFPIEIKPLSRPFAVWAGSVFVGQVLMKGKPVPGAEVEVEFLAEGKIKAANDELVTFVVKADQNGVFSVGMPKPGWWGFAALVDAPKKYKGKKVEWGGVLWLKTDKW